MKRRRQQQSGYALLMALLIGAVIAISLYREIPRVAFNSQRQKEQLLIERGEQYKRAIQLFVKTNQRWPAKIEELESFNNVRFLRKRFVDPMTGKDEWRMVHIQNGILQDSVTTKKDQSKGPTAPTDTYVGLQAGIGQTLSQPGSQGNNIAMRRRASDNLSPGLGESQPDLQGQPQPQPGQPVQSGQPLQPGQPPFNLTGPPPGVLPPGVSGVGMNGQPVQFGQPGQNGQPGQQLQQIISGNPPFGGRNVSNMVGVVNQNGQPGSNQSSNQSGSSYIGGGSSYIGGGSYIGSTPVQNNNPGLPPQPGAPVNSQTGGVSPVPYPTYPGANGNPPNFQQPGMQTGQQGNQMPNPAAQMINNLLTQPRPGGMPTNTSPGGLVGAGIAGVASNLDSDSIMIYNDRQNYSEWEFLFDPAKQKPVMNPVTGQIGTPASQLGNMPKGTPGTPVPPNPNVPNPFGGSPIPQPRPGLGRQ